MKLIIELDLSNDATTHSDGVPDERQIARILRFEVERIKINTMFKIGTDNKILDYNGNSIGSVRITEES